ncbi:hypothetical protein D3C72_1076570 [compost metagenome]
MHVQLGLDLETMRMRRERFDIAPRKHPVAGEHVAKAPAKDFLHRARQQLVAPAMARPVGLALVARFRLGLHARAHYHVQLLVDQPVDQDARRRGMVGRIAIGHHIHICVHIGEHAANHIAFSLEIDVAQMRADFNGQLSGSIGREIVEDVDFRFRQRRAKALDHRAHRQLLVVAGKDDGNALVAIELDWLWCTHFQDSSQSFRQLLHCARCFCGS